MYIVHVYIVHLHNIHMHIIHVHNIHMYNIHNIKDSSVHVVWGDCGSVGWRFNPRPRRCVLEQDEPESLPAAVSTVCECNMIVSRFG